MKPDLLRTILGFLVALAVLVPAILIQREEYYQTQLRQQQFRDTLYLPNSEYIRAASLGYDHFVADFLWLRMIQSFAAGWSRPENAEHMMHYFNVITDLDPRFEDVYSLAIMAVGEKAGRHDLVEQVVRKGIVKNPSRYRIPFEGAFYTYFTKNDSKLARLYVRMAEKDPDAPAYLSRWDSYFNLKEGRYLAAYENYVRNYINLVARRSDRGSQAEADVEEEVLLKNLTRAMDLWITSQIEPIVRAGHERTGQWPDIDELDRTGAFAGLQAPDFPMLFKVLQEIRSGAIARPSGQEVEQLMASALKTWDRLPPSHFEVFEPVYRGYVVWPDAVIPE